MQELWITFRKQITRGCLGLLVAATPMAGGTPARSATPTFPWVATWTSAQTAPYGTEVLPASVLDNSTVREVVHVSVGGTTLRLHLSNRFGAEPLVLRSVHVALPGPDHKQSHTASGTDKVLTFGGATAVSLPAGAEYLSDPLPFPVAPSSDLAISLAIEHAPEAATLHAGAHATTFLATGDYAAATDLPAPTTMTRWCFLSAVEVSGGPPHRGTVVAFGDSITDGHGSTTDGNDRWPDLLAARLSGTVRGKSLAIVNEGIGGNRLLADGTGPNALSRISRDGLEIAGARCMIVLEGINDIGSFDRVTPHTVAEHQALVGSLEAALEQIVVQAHAHGLRVLGGTLTPFRGASYYHPSERTETDRQTLNSWIRTSGHFDAVVDFDLALRDPAYPDRLLPAADSGDHLHPGPEGYRRMAATIPLDQLPQ